MIRASKFKTNEAQKHVIKKEVSDIIKSIDSELILAHANGKQEAILRVPIHFNIPHMNNKDAQRVIYYNILIDLIAREFNPVIEMKENETIFYVKWISPEEEEEIQKQTEYLARYTKKDT